MKLILYAKGINVTFGCLDLWTRYCFKKFNMTMLGRRQGKSNELAYFEII